MAALWMHRPTEAEHEELLKAMKDGDYPSVSAFVREAVMRLVYVEDKRPLFSQLRDVLVKGEELVTQLESQLTACDHKGLCLCEEKEEGSGD